MTRPSIKCTITTIVMVLAIIIYGFLYMDTWGMKNILSDGSESFAEFSNSTYYARFYNDTSTCHVYMMPYSWGAYFHLWDALFASLRISKWNFTCNNTIIYTDGGKSKRIPENIFGKYNVFDTDKLLNNPFAIDSILNNMASYFNRNMSLIRNINPESKWLYKLKKITCQVPSIKQKKKQRKSTPHDN
eukprot:121408_1